MFSITLAKCHNVPDYLLSWHLITPSQKVTCNSDYPFNLHEGNLHLFFLPVSRQYRRNISTPYGDVLKVKNHWWLHLYYFLTIIIEVRWSAPSLNTLWFGLDRDNDAESNKEGALIFIDPIIKFLKLILYIVSKYLTSSFKLVVFILFEQESNHDSFSRSKSVVGTSLQTC